MIHETPFGTEAPDPVWLVALRDIAKWAGIGAVVFLLPLGIYSYCTRPPVHSSVVRPAPSSIDRPVRAEPDKAVRESTR